MADPVKPARPFKEIAEQLAQNILFMHDCREYSAVIADGDQVQTGFEQAIELAVEATVGNDLSINGKRRIATQMNELLKERKS